MGTCCLVAACDFNEADFSARHRDGQFDFVVAVDGGYASLRSIGVDPDMVLGDFDSLGYVPDGENVEAHPVHKDKSDLELAFDWVVARGLYDEVVVYGALGGRLDHSVANLQMCARFAELGLTVTLVGCDAAVRLLVGPGVFEVPTTGPGTVSVFSAVDEAVGVCERGMEYPLDGASLTNRTTLGLSNELIGQVASVSVESGTLFVFYPAGHLA